MHDLRSAVVGDRFRIFLGECGLDDRPAAVLYLLDANGYFGAAVDAIRSMQLSAHLPPMLVVGIGYPVGILAETIVQRTRDLTPTRDEGFAQLFPAQSQMGGAPAFLRFLVDELQPWVRARHALAPGGSMLFGHSLGGLFATYALLSEPAAFDRYGIASPSYWWGHGDIAAIERQCAAGRADLAAAAYFGIGEHETHEGRQVEASRRPRDEAALAGDRHIDMVADMHGLVATLRGRGYPGLVLHEQVLPGEFHITVGPLALSRALRTLYGAPH
jgi:predicted alpha/beta superfamily hydrolase